MSYTVSQFRKTHVTMVGRRWLSDVRDFYYNFSCQKVGAFDCVHPTITRHQVLAEVWLEIVSHLFYELFPVNVRITLCCSRSSRVWKRWGLLHSPCWKGTRRCWIYTSKNNAEMMQLELCKLAEAPQCKADIILRMLASVQEIVIGLGKHQHKLVEHSWLSHIRTDLYEHKLSSTPGNTLGEVHHERPRGGGITTLPHYRT